MELQLQARSTKKHSGAATPTSPGGLKIHRGDDTVTAGNGRTIPLGDGAAPGPHLPNLPVPHGPRQPPTSPFQSSSCCGFCLVVATSRQQRIFTVHVAPYTCCVPVTMAKRFILSPPLLLPLREPGTVTAVAPGQSLRADGKMCHRVHHAGCSCGFLFSLVSLTPRVLRFRRLVTPDACFLERLARSGPRSVRALPLPLPAVTAHVLLSQRLPVSWFVAFHGAQAQARPRARMREGDGRPETACLAVAPRLPRRPRLAGGWHGVSQPPVLQAGSEMPSWFWLFVGDTLSPPTSSPFSPPPAHPPSQFPVLSLSHSFWTWRWSSEPFCVSLCHRPTPTCSARPLRFS